MTVEKSDLPAMSFGKWRISKVVPTKHDIIRSKIKEPDRALRNEVITVLYRDGEIVMSDSKAELSDIESILSKINGNVLVAGLGLGICLNAIAAKNDVKKIVLVEKDEELIENIAPLLPGLTRSKTVFMNEDIFDFKPSRDTKFDVMYFDIWDTFCAKNYPDMKELKKKFKKFSRKSLFWMEREVRHLYKEVYCE